MPIILRDSSMLCLSAIILATQAAINTITLAIAHHRAQSHSHQQLLCNALFKFNITQNQPWRAPYHSIDSLVRNLHIKESKRVKENLYVQKNAEQIKDHVFHSQSVVCKEKLYEAQTPHFYLYRKDDWLGWVEMIIWIRPTLELPSHIMRNGLALQ